MDRERADHVHPAFAEILSNLTPDEAKILRQLARRLPQPLIVSVTVATVAGIFAKHVGDDAEFDVLPREIDFARSAALPSYLDNLERLGLINRRGDSFEPRPTEAVSSPQERDRRHYFLAYLRACGVPAAHEALESFLRKLREAPWKSANSNRAWINLELVWPTAFGEELIRASSEPSEVERLSKITADDVAAEAHREEEAQMADS